MNYYRCTTHDFITASGLADGGHVPGVATVPIFPGAFNEHSVVGATQMTE
jgi:hypothetical protein